MGDSVLYRYRYLSVEQFVAYLTSLEGQLVVAVIDCAGWDDETGEEIEIAKGTILTFGAHYPDRYPPHDDITHCYVWYGGRKLVGVALDEIREV